MRGQPYTRPSDPGSRDAAPALSVVMPIFNEEAIVADSVGQWLECLRAHRVDFELLLIDDGSTDRTPAILEALAHRSEEVVLLSHPNAGHGPTIFRGYQAARGEWVPQIDSDGEVFPSDFSEFWNCRHRYDVQIGVREGRRHGFARSILSHGALLWARLCFGAVPFTDVNCPFRLMRRGFLQRCAKKIPESTFSPNVVLSSLALKDGWKCRQVPVRWAPRRSGAGLRLNRRAIRGAVGTALLLFRLARTGRNTRVRI